MIYLSNLLDMSLLMKIIPGEHRAH